MPRVYILNQDITNRITKSLTVQRGMSPGDGQISFEMSGFAEISTITQCHIDLLTGERFALGYIDGYTTTLENGNIRTVPKIEDPSFHIFHLPIPYGRYKGLFKDVLEEIVDKADGNAILPEDYFCDEIEYNDPIFGLTLIEAKLKPIEIFSQGNDNLATVLDSLCLTISAKFTIDPITGRLFIYHPSKEDPNRIILNLDQIRTGCVPDNLKGIHDISYSEQRSNINSVLFLGKHGDRSIDDVTELTETLKIEVTKPQLVYNLTDTVDAIKLPKLIYTVSNPLGSYDFHHYSYTERLANITYTLGYLTGPTGTVRRYPPFVGILYRFTALLDRPIGFFRGAMTAPPFTKTEDNWGTVQTMTPTPSNDSQIYNNVISENVIGTVDFSAIRADQTGLKLVIVYWFNRDGNKNVGGLINPANFLNVGEMEIKLSLADTIIRQWNFTSSDATPLDRFANTKAEVFDLAELGLNHLVGSQQLKLELTGDMNFGFQFTRFFRGSETGPVPVPLLDYYTVVGCTYHFSAFLTGEQSRIDAILADPIGQAGFGQFPYGYLGPSVFDNFGVVSGPQLFDSEP